MPIRGTVAQERCRLASRMRATASAFIQAGDQEVRGAGRSTEALLVDDMQSPTISNIVDHLPRPGRYEAIQ